MRKALKMLAVLILAAAPLGAVAAPAAAAGTGLGPVASTAGLSTEFSKWVCKHYGIAC